MLRLILVLCVVVLAVGKTIYEPNLDWDSRIVGGSNAVEGQIPYQVSLRHYIQYHFCGGSILNTKWVLTAAHCVFGKSPNSMQVVVGSILLNSGGIFHNVSAIVINPDYYADAILVRNDVAVIQTVTTITFTSYVQPIALGSAFVGGGVVGTASGWGLTSFPGNVPNNLQVIQLSTINFYECRSVFINVSNSTQICTFTRSGQGMCQGDSGGPLAVGEGESRRVIGIVSYGIPCARGFPDVWTRVSFFRVWIINNTI